MIKVNRLDDREIVVNAELIETVEATPDTIITLTTGKKIIARDPVDEVIQKVIAYRRAIASPSGSGGAPVGPLRGFGM